MALEEDFNEAMLAMLRDLPMQDIYQVCRRVGCLRVTASLSVSIGIIGRNGSPLRPAVLGEQVQHQHNVTGGAERCCYWLLQVPSASAPRRSFLDDQLDGDSALRSLLDASLESFNTRTRLDE